MLNKCLIAFVATRKKMTINEMDSEKFIVCHGNFIKKVSDIECSTAHNSRFQHCLSNSL